jgi:hypothetical protein
MTANSPSFHSPLLASLRRTGADDAVPRSPVPSTDDFLMRRRTPGAAERPAASPGLFPAGGASAAPHRPSPLGLPPRTAATTTTFSSSTTPRSGGTGTNFKARLKAMQVGSSGGATAGTPPAAGGFTRPGSLGWGGGVPAYRPLHRPTPTAGAAGPSSGRPSAGPAPPGASLADELQQLRLEVDSVSLAGTPTKPAHTSGLGSNPATPASTATAASPGFRGLTVHPGARIPTSSGAGVAQWSPMVASGAGRSRGRKAMGAGALNVSRPGAAAAVPLAAQPSTALSVEIPGTMSEALRSRSQSPTKAPRGGDSSAAAAEGATEATASAVDGLRRKLRAEMPEFGVGEWEPPAAPQAHGPPKTERGAGGGGDALAALATLRQEADAQLQGGGVAVLRDDDAVCNGVRAAFREALGTPDKAGAAAGDGGAARRTPPPKEVEQRLERLRLLREQAVKVSAMPATSPSGK